MRTHSGNIGSVLADIGETTLESLRRYDIPFHEIYFGKPYADFYIDDLAINTQSNIEKEIGVYRTKIRERGFNNIDFKTIETVRKASNDLEKIRGEVHWYENIPESVNDLFPRFLGKSSDGYSYELEKITGVAMTYLFINQLVTTEILHQLLLSLERIHSSTGESIENSPEVDIYANYSSKMKIRYDSFDYSELPGSEEVFEKLQSDLGAYASQGLGEKCIIHGDPVFSNIIIKENNEFMFIDMRGEIDGKETIFGDKWYDFGKVYQSIIGYDEILMNTITNREYKAGLKRDFEEYISKNYGEERMEKIKLITNSLIFSLLPLHDSDLVTDFYGLIEVR